MTVSKLITDLDDIAKNPKPNYVTISKTKYGTKYTFPEKPPATDAYYFPAGIVTIEIQRSGADVIYVGTTSNQYPHLTIPFSGTNIHFSFDAKTKSDNLADWPQAIRRFYKLYFP
jgi:hypothetical protein